MIGYVIKHNGQRHNVRQVKNMHMCGAVVILDTGEIYNVLNWVGCRLVICL